MAEKPEILYSPGMTPKELAEKVLEEKYGRELPSIPIDPFQLMRDYGIIYQFMGFKDLEGIYLVPEDGDDIAVVGINYKRRITRQRYTAAHELCHHLKDRQNEACPIGSKNGIEIQLADVTKEYKELLRVTIRELFRTIITIQSNKYH